MDIVGHRLVSTSGDGVKLEYREGSVSPFSFRPEIALLHCGVTESLDEHWSVKNSSGFVAHVSIDSWVTQVKGDPVRSAPKLIQAVDFDKRCAHAGASSWRGRPGCNGYALGLRISNPGPLVEKGGELFTVYGKRWPRVQAAKARHWIQGVGYDWWASFSDEEVTLCVKVLSLWRKHYGIVDVIGNDQVAQPEGSKIDMGPAFPIELVRRAVFSDISGAPPALA